MLQNRGVTVTPKPPDPRQVRTRARVYAAALEVLRRDGLGATTFDAIAHQAGVARSTLYRNWASRDDLLADATQQQAPVPGPKTDQPTSVHLENVLNHMSAALSDTQWGRVLPAALAASEASPELFDRHRNFTTARRAEFTKIVTAGKNRGDLPTDLVDDDFVDALVGPLYYRRLIRRLRTNPAWIRQHLRRTLTAFGAVLDTDTQGDH